MAPLSLFNGMFLPYPTMVLLGAYSAGRMFYAQGYAEKEGANNQMRILGAVLCHSTNFITIMTSLIIGIQLSRGKFP